MRILNFRVRCCNLLQTKKRSQRYWHHGIDWWG
jgi:hypothetical protein